MASGHLEKRSKDGWTIIIDHGYQKDPVTGKMKEVRKSYPYRHVTQKWARAKMIDMLAKIHAGTFVEPSPITILEYGRRWLLTSAKGRVGKSAYESYERQVEQYIKSSKLAMVRMTDAAPEDFREFYAELRDKGLGMATLRYAHLVLRSMYNQAVEDKLLPWSPVSVVKLPGARQGSPSPMSAAEIAAFLAEAKRVGVPRRYEGKMWACGCHELFRIALATGMRRGELVALKRSRVDLRAAREEGTGRWLGLIRVAEAASRVRGDDGRRETEFGDPKSEAGIRDLPLDADSTEILAGLLARHPHELVFCYTDGSPLSPPQVSKKFTELARKAGLEGVTFHSQRHTYGTTLADEGVDLFTLQELMGHADIASTRIYSRVSKERKRDAVRKLGGVLAKADTQQSRGKSSGENVASDRNTRDTLGESK